MKLDLPPEKRKRLLDAYLTLKPWPDPHSANALGMERLKLKKEEIVFAASSKAE